MVMVRCLQSQFGYSWSKEWLGHGEWEEGWILFLSILSLSGSLIETELLSQRAAKAKLADLPVVTNVFWGQKQVVQKTFRVQFSPYCTP